MMWGMAVFASVLAAAGTTAATSPGPVARARLELGARSTVSCTSSPDLAARIAVRSPRIHLVDDATAIGVQATFAARRGGGVDAELVLVEAGAARPPRRFWARSCAEAADAVAVMVALALDPVWVAEHGATTADAAGTLAPARAVAGTTEGAPGTATAPRLTVPRSPGPPRVEEKTAETAAPTVVDAPAELPAAPSSPSSPPWRRRLGVQVAGQGLWGPAPRAMPGVAVYIMGAMDRPGVLSPALALGAFYAWRTELDEPGGKASFSLVAGSVDACLLRLQLARLAIRACGAAVVGRLSASGSDTDNPARVPRPFVVAGGASIVTLPLGHTVELWARVGAGTTWPSNQYELGSTVFYTSSRLTTSASLGLGVGWW